jgi:hypothetical protein
MTSIRLVSCITLSLDDELQVEAGNLPDRLDGHTSHDQMFGPVKSLLESHRLQWSDTFVSLFVLLPDDATAALDEAFGYPLELKIDEVIPDVALACSDDIQNWIQRTTPHFKPLNHCHFRTLSWVVQQLLSVSRAPA